MTEKRKYEKPALQVFELKQQQQLLAGSDPFAINTEGATIEDYEDGVFTW